MMQSKSFQIEDYINNGLPQLSDFHLVTENLPTLSADQVLVKNLYMSVDPYMRGRMMDRKSYIPPFELNTAMQGGAVGIVENSTHEGFKTGDYVLSFNGWRDFFVAEEKDLEKLDLAADHLPLSLAALGMPGLTAYGALLTIGKPKEGDTVFVSAAAGAVGSLVCQIAKLKGCKVIASVGSDDKAAWLENECNVDHAFNYNAYDRIETALNDFAPDGIDIYFENVGGEHLEAALNTMNVHGRIVMCGMISQYNADKPQPGPTNLMQIVAKQLIMQGFLVFDFEPLKKEFLANMSQWLKDGKIKTKFSIVEQIENAPQAFLDLFNGKNVGKMLVKL